MIYSSIIIIITYVNVSEYAGGINKICLNEYARKQPLIFIYYVRLNRCKFCKYSVNCTIGHSNWLRTEIIIERKL